MRSFKDNAGREWQIEVTVDLVEVVRDSSLELNLLDVVDEARAEEAYRRLSDPITLVRVLWRMIEDAATAKGVTAKQFGAAMGGDALDAAAQALDDSLVDFFPRSLRRVMQAAQAKIREIEAKAVDRQLQTMNDPRVATAIDETLSRLATESISRLEEQLQRPRPSSSSATNWRESYGRT